MKQLTTIFAFVFLATFNCYPQSAESVCPTADLGHEYRKPENLETAKDIFQGVWAITIKSPEGKTVDTVVASIQNYSTKYPDLIFFSSLKSDSLLNVVEPEKVTFFQSDNKSTIRFAIGQNKVVNFDGVLSKDCKIAARAVDSSKLISAYSGYVLEAVKVSASFSRTFACGNDDGKRPEDPPHGRHLGTSAELKSLEEKHGCKKWKSIN